MGMTRSQHAGFLFLLSYVSLAAGQSRDWSIDCHMEIATIVFKIAPNSLD
jgi:hypothetical protein